VPHSLADQGALVLGDRPADLEQELLMWGVADRLVEELDAAAGALESVCSLSRRRLRFLRIA